MDYKLNQQGIMNLASAVILQAAKDYQEYLEKTKEYQDALESNDNVYLREVVRDLERNGKSAKRLLQQENSLWGDILELNVAAEHLPERIEARSLNIMD